MKKLIFFSFLTMTALWLGCGQQADVNAMLKNPDSKEKIFSTITSDHDLMTEFMTKMMANEHAMMMMKGNHDMMGKMMGNGNMMQMMKDNPNMMHNMMSGMMKDGNMMGHMLQMMNQEGLMSDECMQSCMKMMKDKGMSMNMGMMNEKDGSAE